MTFKVQIKSPNGWVDVVTTGRRNGDKIIIKRSRGMQ